MIKKEPLTLEKLLRLEEYGGLLTDPPSTLPLDRLTADVPAELIDAWKALHAAKNNMHDVLESIRAITQ